MGAQFYEAANSVTSKLSSTLESLNKLQSNQEATFHFEDECCSDDSKDGMPQSTQFLQKQNSD